MIGVIYSYVKSAVVFSVMLAVVIAGAIVAGMFTQATLDLVLRLVGLAALLLASYAATYAYTFKLVGAEINRTGGEECDVEKLKRRLRKLSQRAYFGSARGALLIEYADTQIYSGEYKDAMITVSDAIVAGKDGIKGEAAVCFCKIFFMRSDADYFMKYFDKAVESLDCQSQSKNSAVRAKAAASKIAVKAMKESLCGDNAAAVRVLDGADAFDAAPLQRRNLAALREYILHGNCDK